jgi:hypothetical protein
MAKVQIMNVAKMGNILVKINLEREKMDEFGPSYSTVTLLARFRG